MASNLLPGENLILKVHQHWVVVIKSLVIPVLLLVVVALLDFTVLYNNYVPHLRTYLSIGTIVIAALWMIVVWIRWQATVYTLTDQRIKIESGIFSRQSKIIPIDRIQDCTTKETVLGRMLGYGRVEVDAAGAQGAEVLNHLPNPGPFRDQVFMQSEKRRGGTPGAQANPSGV
jgi:uncharacterized membrane protein YdbT with pleckstrin-like domain